MTPLKFLETEICNNTYIDNAGYKKAPKQVLDQMTAKYDRNLEEKDMKYVTQSNNQAEFITTRRYKPRNQIMQFVPGPNDKIDWSPLGTLTGTRPDVNKFSSSRYSLEEWRNYNATVLDGKKINESNILQYNSRTAAMSAFGNIDKVQQENNKRLKQRAKEVFRWKVEVEVACKEIAKETELLERERQRIKIASKVLMLPASICKECIELRSNRAQTDLVEDLPELQLRKEMELINNMKEILRTALIKTEEQLAINRAAKHKMEYDWCDKTTAYNTDTINLSLSNTSNTLMFRPGATKFFDKTAPIVYYDYFCRENINNVEAVHQASADWRSNLNVILINNSKKLRDHADKTDKALAETVVHTTELLIKMEEHRRQTLQSLMDVNKLILNLQSSIRKTDVAMKLAQTRLDNRNNFRPHQENVRDPAHFGLMKEVKIIHETATSLLAQLYTAEQTRNDLLEKRHDIEKNITFKRKTLIIDRERCGMIRSHYPTASELAGL